MEDGKVVAAIKRGSINTQPSLGLLAALYHQWPNHTFYVDIDPLGQKIQVGVQEPGRSSTKPTPLNIRISSIAIQPKDDELRGTPGDSVKALVALRFPPNDAVQRATLTLGQAARMDSSELRSRLGGKVVVFGQHLLQGNGTRMDEHPMSGKQVWGTHAKMVCIDQLITDNMPKLPSQPQSWIIAILSTLAGAVAAVLLRRWLAVLAAVFGLTLLIIISSIVAYRTTGYLINPTVSMFGVLIAAALATPLMMQLRRVRPLEVL